MTKDTMSSNALGFWLPLPNDLEQLKQNLISIFMERARVITLRVALLTGALVFAIY